MDRFYDFKSIKLVHIGTGSARIIEVTRQRVHYIDEVGTQLTGELEEWARMYLCLDFAGLFPPGDDTDWGRLADATPGFSTLDVPEICCVGLRGAIDDPPWFQFLD